MNSKKIISNIYLGTAIIAFAAGVQGIISIMTVEELPNKILHMLKMIMNGKNTLAYSHFIGTEITKPVAYMCIGYIVLLISRKIAHNDNEPCLENKLFLFVMVFLIGMETYRLLAFMMLDAIVYIFFLMLMLIYSINKINISRHQAVNSQRNVKRSTKICCAILIILCTALLFEFIMTIYMANKYPGQLIEYL